MALRRWMIPVGSPLLLHAARAPWILKGGVEPEEQHAFVLGELMYQLVQVANRAVAFGITVVPGQNVSHRHQPSQLHSAENHRPNVRRRVSSLTALNKIVNSTLDDDHVHSRLDRVETARDLVGAFTVDAVIADQETLFGLFGPVRPLMALVDGAGRYPRSDVWIRVPFRRSCGDRIADCGDDDV